MCIRDRQYSQYITKTVFRGNRVRQMIHANLDRLDEGEKVDNKDVTNRFLGLAGVPVDSWCGEKEAFLGRYHGYGNPVGVIDGKLNCEGNYNENSCGALTAVLKLAPVSYTHLPSVSFLQSWITVRHLKIRRVRTNSPATIITGSRA